MSAAPDGAARPPGDGRPAPRAEGPSRPDAPAAALIASLERLRATALALEEGGASGVLARWSLETVPTAHAPRGPRVEHVAVRGLATGLASAGMLSLLAAVVGMLAMQALPAPPRPSTTVPAQVASGIPEGAPAGR